MPLSKKPFRQVRADEACTAGEENFHGSANGEVESSKRNAKREVRIGGHKSTTNDEFHAKFDKLRRTTLR